MTAEVPSPHVLLVDDTQEILDLLRELLEDEGYRVTTSLALLNTSKVRALAPDVIVQELLFAEMQETDWRFPIEDLLTALNEILTAQVLITEAIEAPDEKDQLRAGSAVAP